MKLMKWLGVLLVACMMLTFAGMPVPAEAAIIGGRLYGTGGDITVTILPSSAGYSSSLILYSPRYEVIGGNWEPGKVVTLTGLPAGEELIFGIYVHNTGHTFQMGPGDRNPDGMVHAGVTQLGERTFDVGFEDLFGGGDRDYDDNVFRFEGALAPEPPPVDQVPPVTAHTESPAANSNGWANQPVTVSLTASDTAQAGAAVSGVAQIYASLGGSAVACGAGDACTFTIGTSGAHAVSFYAMDNAGNMEAARGIWVNVDLDAPVVTYSGNAGSYTVDQMIAITCSSADALSGVASDTCAPISGAASAFGPGTYSYTASATDRAGNTGSASVSFTVSVTAESLCRLVEEWSSKPGVASSLCAKLRNAAKAATPQARANLLEAFGHEVEAQSGKSFAPDKASLLIALAGQL